MVYPCSNKACRRLQMARFALRSLAFVLVSLWAAAQPGELDKPVPILTGSIGNCSFVTGGNNLLDCQVNPILLVPFGDHLDG